MSDIEDVQNLVNSVPREGLANVLDAVSEQRRGRDRTWIVRGVLVLYVVSIAVSIGYQIIRGDEDASAGISETIKIGVIPMFTLVIGYYFGTAKS